MASNTIERSKQEIPMSNYGMETRIADARLGLKE
jgi:hypothetical protein